MARMPGAIWKPISKSRAARRKGRGICLHVAVSEAASLHGYFSGATSDSHFYVRKDGTIEQYVDTDLVAYANAAGNSSLISVETQGGVTNADREPWTPAQVAALARIVRWSADIDGFPLQPMPDSRPASRGVGYHKLGCRPWVVSGGELWSSATGKICPGAGKIAQIPQVIAQAKNLNTKATPAPKPAPVEDDMPYTPVELGNITSDAIANRVIASVGGKPYHAWEAWRDAGLKGVDAQKLAAEIVAKLPTPTASATAGNGLTKQDVESAVRAVFADVADPA